MAYVVTNPVSVQILERAAQATYQGHSSIAIQLLTANGLSFDDLRSYLIAKGGMPSLQGLGLATPAVPATATTPVDTSTEPVAQQLSQIRMDWPSGTLYVGSNKYSLLTTLIGGLVIKGIMWGGGKMVTKVTGPTTPLIAAEEGRSRRNPRRRNPFLLGLLPKLATGGTYAVGEYGVGKLLKKRSRRRRS